MTKDELTQRVWEAIDRRAEHIIGLGEQIRRTPELGFKEVLTARLVEETFDKMGLASRGGLALTGVRADAPGRAGDGPTFAVMGELDALVVAGHPEADAESGAPNLLPDVQVTCPRGRGLVHEQRGRARLTRRTRSYVRLVLLADGGCGLRKPGGTPRGTRADRALAHRQAVVVDDKPLRTAGAVRIARPVRAVHGVRS